MIGWFDGKAGRGGLIARMYLLAHYAPDCCHGIIGVESVRYRTNARYFVAAMRYTRGGRAIMTANVLRLGVKRI
jgi:hypothetical protein